MTAQPRAHSDPTGQRKYRQSSPRPSPVQQPRPFNSRNNIGDHYSGRVPLRKWQGFLATEVQPIETNLQCFGHPDYKIVECMCKKLHEMRQWNQEMEAWEAWETDPHWLLTMVNKVESHQHRPGQVFNNLHAARRWHPDRVWWVKEEEKQLATKIFQLHRDIFQKNGRPSTHVPHSQARPETTHSPQSAYRTPQKKSPSEVQGTPQEQSSAETQTTPAKTAMPSSPPMHSRSTLDSARLQPRVVKRSPTDAHWTEERTAAPSDADHSGSVRNSARRMRSHAPHSHRKCPADPPMKSWPAPSGCIQSATMASQRTEPSPGSREGHMSDAKAKPSASYQSGSACDSATPARIQARQCPPTSQRPQKYAPSGAPSMCLQPGTVAAPRPASCPASCAGRPVQISYPPINSMAFTPASRARAGKATVLGGLMGSHSAPSYSASLGVSGGGASTQGGIDRPFGSCWLLPSTRPQEASAHKRSFSTMGFL